MIRRGKQGTLEKKKSDREGSEQEEWRKESVSRLHDFTQIALCTRVQRSGRYIWVGQDPLWDSCGFLKLFVRRVY
eukprot:814657-Amorphochlora_amoeboformis.AAC.1